MRLPHLKPFAKNPLLFLTACTAQRRPLLAADPCFSALLETWRRSADIDGWYVGRFVVMPDHVHLFARPTWNAVPLAAWIKAWKSITARQIAAARQICPPVWQLDYFDHFVRSAHSYSEKWEYVRHNPVRAGLVGNPEAWPWQGMIHDLSF